MLLHLIKKDFLLIKKYIFLMMLLAIGMPLFVVTRIPGTFGLEIICFIYSVVFTELMTCQFVAMEEAKYPKAAALICAVSYPRSIFVIAKYVFFLLLFFYCFVIYNLMVLIVPSLTVIELNTILVILLAAIVLYGIYLPLYFKFGFEKTKIFFISSIFAMSFGTPIYFKYLSNIKIAFSAFEAMPPVILNFALALASIVVLGFSIVLSIKIYSNKEL